MNAVRDSNVDPAIDPFPLAATLILPPPRVLAPCTRAHTASPIAPISTALRPISKSVLENAGLHPNVTRHSLRADDMRPQAVGAAFVTFRSAATTPWRSEGARLQSSSALWASRRSRVGMMLRRLGWSQVSRMAARSRNHLRTGVAGSEHVVDRVRMAQAVHPLRYKASRASCHKAEKGRCNVT